MHNPYIILFCVVWYIIGIAITIHNMALMSDIKVSHLLYVLLIATGGPMLIIFYIVEWWMNQDFTNSFINKVLIKKIEDKNES